MFSKQYRVWAGGRNFVSASRSLKILHADESVTYKEPIGGGYYISITSGFWCIDIRKWFLPHRETDIKLTLSGLRLGLREWRVMKQIVESINSKYPTLGTTLPCYMSDDHLNQIGALQCRDCYPFVMDF